MALQQIRNVNLVEEREKREMEKLEDQADAFEIIAMLYEEMEGLKARIKVLEGGVK